MQSDDLPFGAIQCDDFAFDIEPIDPIKHLRDVADHIRGITVKNVNREYLDDVAFMIEWACARIENAGKTE